MSRKNDKGMINNDENQKDVNKTKQGEEPADADMQTGRESASEAEESKTEKTENDLATQLADMNDKYLRLYSDFDNYRKRVNKEKLDMIKTASSGVVLTLLPVIDDMERALKAFQETVSSDSSDENSALSEGVVLIYNKLLGVLKQQGVNECEVLDKAFDPEIAEAVAQIPAPEEAKKGKVLDVVQKGYMIDGKVIRFAKVVVGC